MRNVPSSVIDLNADLGEGFPNDARLLELVSSASLCCGAHAGDRDTLRSTLEIAKSRGVHVGAHPGFPDREGSGRREQDVSAVGVERLILEQVEFLASLAGEVGVDLLFLKPHGALYNQAQRQEEVARGVVSAARRLGLPLLGQPESILKRLAQAAEVLLITEGFPDRRYNPEGRLIARTAPDSVLRDHSEIEAQVDRLVHQGVATLCIHGDEPNAVENASLVRAVLLRRQISVRFWGARN
ncbi:MAG: 5-oxoprolinase subunit PxpA [Isosphaeraceae bacterium]